jgi:K+-sensing histidine kinase KdpD
MPADHTVVVHPALVATVTALLVGVMALWANPQRTLNRYFFSFSVHVSVWTYLVYQAVSSSDGLIWVRAICVVAGWFPLHLWSLKEAVLRVSRPRTAQLRRTAPWVALCLFASIIPLTEWFVPGHSTTSHREYGAGYFVYVIINVGAYLLLCRETVLQARKQLGVARIELQVLLIGTSLAALTMLALMGARAAFPSLSDIQVQPLVVIAFYALTVLAMTTHRIFGPRYLLRIAMKRFVLVCTVAGLAYGTNLVLQLVVQEPLAFLLTTALVLSFASALGAWLDGASGRYPKAEQARAALIDAARSAEAVSDLAKRFESVLAGWGDTESAVVHFREDNRLRSPTQSAAISEDLWRFLLGMKWATPERVNRERLSESSIAVGSFLSNHRFGVVVAIKGATLEVVVGLGVRPSGRPFTYPEVAELGELVSMVEGFLARTMLAAKAQHSERLATVGLLGASVAHEIRNPLVSIKTFVQLFPTHYQDENFRNRFSGLIVSEVARIERLTEQLLDLASPRKYLLKPTSLHEVVRASRDLIVSKAEDKRVELLSDLLATPDVVLIDGNAAKQVILNLCFNSIQAQENQERPRWIRISTRNVARGVELTVADNGPGISAEIRPRLFEAFQTTKSSGFGLGLAICSDILSSLGSSIRVDPFVSGQGATFRVVFPCPPPSS